MSETFNKKEKEKKRREKQVAKQERKEQRKMQSIKGAPLSDMMAYVDENGNLTSTPVDFKNKKDVSIDEIQISIPKLEDRALVDTKKGVVKFFNQEKGFGFIQENNNKIDLFFHINSLVHAVNMNDRVSFEVVRGKKGPEAVNITKL
ncbi:cold-shock protein [Rhizosphaericola mali]|uniref:Cold shock domain-containing protein n=1 Tax=Rhizosphaericola mali TaxID=2545455 RepID=A0A5P2G404_9BACT|nr:cold shock domain-containing protein [Rhizosphaericola mali]QES87833.1 cold shock domain-containing protein [Rhizosphaericola mali]